MHVKLNLSLLAALLAVSPLAAPPARADDAPTLSLPDLLARHLQALGKHDVTRTERETGTYETGGLQGTYTVLTKGLDRYLEEYKLGPDDTLSGSDGKVTWQRDSNGSVRLLSSNELKNERTDQYIGSASYAVPGRLPGTQTLRPQTEKRTGDYIVDIVPEGGQPATLFFDPKTFLLVKDQHQDDDQTITTTYSDFKLLNGTMTATTQRVSNGDKRDDQTLHTASDEVGVDAPDTLFAMPAAAKDYEWLDPKTTSAVIPYDASDHSINFFVGINGAGANVILDSGASNLAISKRATDVLKIKPAGTLQARGYGGTTNRYLITLDTLEIPDAVVFQNLTGNAIDLHNDYNYLYESSPEYGLVGYPLLSQLVVQIDYRAHHFTLYDPATWTPAAADGQPLPMELNDNVPSVSAQFDGLPAGRFLVDTGDAGCVRLYTPFVSQNKLSEKYPKGMDVTGYGVGGESKGREIKAGSFTLAGVTLKNVPTVLSMDTKGGASQVLQGALGHDFLSHFTVTFDYPHQRIFFAPTPDTQKPFDTRTFGIMLIRLPDPLVKDKMRIVAYHVEPQSPAYKAGLLDADSITAVDGQSADALGLGEVRRLLSPEGGEDARTLSIIGGAGGTGTVKVSLYDPVPVSPK